MEKGSISTNNLDIVYTLKDRPDNEEFRYSLRSLENMPHKKVWVYGGCPIWVNKRTVKHVPLAQEQSNKWTNTAMLLQEICKNENITEDFIWFNDDFFVLKEIDTLSYYKDRNLLARAYDFVKLGWWQFNGAYPSRLKVSSRELKLKGYSNDNFELHLPIVFNRKKLLDIYEKFPNLGAKRSLYCNYYGVPGIQRDDIKIYDYISIPDENWDFVSTTDGTFREGKVGEYIRKKFKNKSKYEKD